MPMWRCPHCGTPQAETARCWVCHRSSTACATCRNYRRSVAGPLGYCGLDRQRQPLRGDEIRACWEASVAVDDAAQVTVQRFAPTRPDLAEDRTPVRRLEFVEVRSAAPTPTPRTRKPTSGRRAGAQPAEVTAASELQAPVTAGEPRWSLWGDGEV